MARLRTILMSISIMLITAIVVGGGVFLWQQTLQKSKSAEYEDQINTIQASRDQAKAEAKAASDAAATKTTPETTTAPVILYTGDGAAALTPAVKTEFTTKLTDPYVAYYAQDGQVPVVSILITVPTKKGDPYKVFAIRKTDGKYENFSYSKLGSPLETWKPTCGTTACSFSDSYKTKYPDVVK